MRRAFRAALLVVGLFWPLALAEVELVLTDGKTLRGKDVRRDGDNYVMTTEDGGAVTLPLQTVLEVRLVEDSPAVESRNLNPDQTQPRTGLQVGGPEQLAGAAVQPTTPAESQKVLGEPAQWQSRPHSDTFAPSKSEWKMQPDVLASSRSTWTQPPTDPQWTPKSSLGEDQLAKHESTWIDPPIDPNWTPKSSWN